MQNRPLRPFEQGAHLHVLDWAHETARYRLKAAGQVQVKAGAKAAVRAGGDAAGTLALPSLQAAVHGELVKLYALGHTTVRSELDHQADGHALPVGLSADPVQLAVAENAGDPFNLLTRAKLIAQAVAHEIGQAVARRRLQGVTQTRALREAGEQAGLGALSVAASHHAGGAINAGRRAAAEGRRAQIVGGRYTSVLDKNSCQPCIDADTGELEPLDSLPPTPNPACLGGDRCRCIIVYQLSTEAASRVLPVAAAR